MKRMRDDTFLLSATDLSRSKYICMFSSAFSWSSFLPAGTGREIKIEIEIGIRDPKRTDGGEEGAARFDVVLNGVGDVAQQALDAGVVHDLLGDHRLHEQLADEPDQARVPLALHTQVQVPFNQQVW